MVNKKRNRCFGSLGNGVRVKARNSVIVLLVLFTLTLGACGVDVGGNDDLFNVAVKNNTSGTVTLGECGNSCASFADTWVIKPGQSASTGQDPDGVSRPMEVLSISKNVLGCLPFQFSKTPPDGTVVNVSQMVPCGQSVGAQVSGGHDWPFSQY